MKNIDWLKRFLSNCEISIIFWLIFVIKSLSQNNVMLSKFDKFIIIVILGQHLFLKKRRFLNENLKICSMCLPAVSSSPLFAFFCHSGSHKCTFDWMFGEEKKLSLFNESVVSTLLFFPSWLNSKCGHLAELADFPTGIPSELRQWECHVYSINSLFKTDFIS